MVTGYATWVISILMCLCSNSRAEWRGRPWHESTNAVSWTYLNEEYQPWQQLLEALIERADVVRATVATNYPYLELVQTWTVDLGIVTNVVGTNEVIVASGFPPSWDYGDDLNGSYYYVSPGTWQRSDSAILELYDGSYQLFKSAWWDGFISTVGPDSVQWFESVYGVPDGGVISSAETVATPAGIQVYTLTTNIITTNAFSPFEYSVDYDGTTYTGTGFPHLTWAALEWLDQQIESVSEYYVPAVTTTSLPPSGASILLWEDDWESHGEFSLVGAAGVGLTETGTYITGGGATGTWTRTKYTRQPDVDYDWLLTEIVHVGTNVWETTAYEVFDVSLPRSYTNGPRVEIYSTNAVPATVDVLLDGLVRNDHWYGTDTITTNETVASGSYATNLWHSITNMDVTVTSGTLSTGDYVVVYYEGPITLYGARPRRLYASDLEERAAVIDALRYMPVKNERMFISAEQGYGPDYVESKYFRKTGGFGDTYTLTQTTDAADVVGGEVPYPSWSTLLGTIEYDVVSLPSSVALSPRYVIWLYRATEAKFALDGYTENNLPVAYPTSSPYEYTTRISIERVSYASRVGYPVTVNTNTLQGTHFPTHVTFQTYAALRGFQNYQKPDTWDYWYTGSWVGGPVYPDARQPAGGLLHGKLAVPDIGQPMPVELDTETHLRPYSIVTENDYPFSLPSGNVTNGFAWFVTSDEHLILTGTHTYVSGYIGYTNDVGGLPLNIEDLLGTNYTDFTDSPVYVPVAPFPGIPPENEPPSGGWSYHVDNSSGVSRYYIPNGISRRTDFAIGGYSYPLMHNEFGWEPYIEDQSTQIQTPSGWIPSMIDWGTTNGFQYRK